MSSIPLIINRRRKQREQSQRSLLRRSNQVGIAFLAITGIVLTAGFGWSALTYSAITRDLPSLEQLPLLLESPNAHLLQPTRLYDRSGEHILLTLENPAVTQRRYLPLADNNIASSLPQNLVDAVVAISDPNFWEHTGFTFESLDLNSPATLAQRLIADLLLYDEPDDQQGRWRQSLLAAQATSRYGREVILEWYLNSADFGQLAYGANAAAHVYFDRPAANLTLAEAAMLAAVSQAPDLNPIDAPQLAIERQGKVLEAMLAQGFITKDQAFNANTLPLEINPIVPYPENRYQAFTDLVLEQLSQRFGLSRLQRGGLKIITTLDLDLQTQTACAAAAQIARLTDQPPDEEGECQAARLLPTLQREDTAAAPGVEASVVIIDPASGQILAYVGDPQAGHTPGSLFAPFVYLTAFTRGFSPASLVWDIPASLPTDLAGYSNPDNEFHGPIRMRTALANDYIAPALHTLNQIGPENVWLTAQQSGLTSIAPANGEPSARLLLDSGMVPLLEFTQSFAMLANQGFLAGQPAVASALNGTAPMQPASVLSVVDHSGRSLLDWEQPQIRAVTSAQLAYLITHILSDEDARRPSLGRPNALEVGRPAAAKLGQTTNRLDTWTVGYTPQLAIGVWVGYPDEGGEPLSPAIAAGLWNAVLKYSHLALPLVDWDVPVGITEIKVCNPSGMLPTLDCPSVVSEVFIPGNEPVHLDNLYRVIEINRLTGRLATVFTSPEDIDEQVFLMVPAEALDWARQTGFPLPPETYDVLFIAAGENPNVTVSGPAMFSYVRGQVEITGTAMGEDFEFYRIQVGEGLNPRQWLQIGPNGTSPVVDGALAVWDTGTSSGLFAIQLIVVYEDQSIQTTTIQVTVDNQVPQVVILFPTDGQVFDYPEERSFTFQIQASDNLGIQRVEFYVDDELITTLTQAPYAAAWLAPVGEHSLRVVVYDLAGNAAETEITFVLER